MFSVEECCCCPIWVDGQPGISVSRSTPADGFRLAETVTEQLGRCSVDAQC